MTYSYDRTKFKTAKDIAADAEVVPSTITRWLRDWGKVYSGQIPKPHKTVKCKRYTQRTWTYDDAEKIKTLYLRHRANHS